MKRVLVVVWFMAVVSGCGGGQAGDRAVAEQLQVNMAEMGVTFSRQDLACLSSVYVSVMGKDNALAYLRQERGFFEMHDDLGTEGAMQQIQELNLKLIDCDAQPE